MTKFVFYYFDVKGLGEGCRLLMVYGGQEFEDRRITREEWPEIKPNTPFGKLPMLEIDSKQYAQSNAISRYFGHKFGLAGESLEDALEIDQNVDLLTDLRIKVIEPAMEQDEAVKEAKFAQYAKDVFPDYLKKLSAIIEKNNGFLALGKLTWGDFVLAGLFDTLKNLTREPELEKKYPALQKVIDNVYSVPQIKAYSEKKN